MLRFAPLVSALFFGLLLPVLGRQEAAPVEVTTEANLPYKSGEALSGYEQERCKLDLYLPAKRTGFSTLVWLYGGGLTAGSKDDPLNAGIARTFARAGMAVAVVNYRLSPKALFPAYAEDAAAAFAWVHGHIAERGGDATRVFLGGHSAGAYLTSLVTMDPRYLQAHGLSRRDLAGALPLSGQMMTHFTVRKERGLPESTVIADEAAPIYYSGQKGLPPFLILFGDHDWPARLEENQYFAAFQKSLGNERVTLQVIPDRTHGTVASRLSEPGDPAAQAIIAFIERVSAERSEQPAPKSGPASFSPPR